MKVLSISIDGSMFDADSDVRSRQEAYASRLDAYTVIVKAANEVEVEDGNMRLIPTNTKTRIGFVMQLFLLCLRLEPREYDVITVQSPFVLGVLGMVLSAIFNLDLKTQSHIDFYDNPEWRRASLSHSVLAPLGKLVLRRSDAIRVGTRHEKQKLDAAFSAPVVYAPVKIKAESMATTCSTDQQASLHEGYALGDGPIVLFVGRLVHQKRLDRWLQIAGMVWERSTVSPTFVVVGKGPKRATLEVRAQELLPASAVVFTGYLSEQELSCIYDLSDVFFISSAYEGTCRVLIEAAVNELPVVATPFAGALDFVQSKRNGFVAAECSVLADHLTWLLERPEERDRMGAAAKHIANETILSADHVGQYIKFLGA